MSSLQRVLDVADASDVDTFKSRLINFAHDLDFGLVSSALYVEDALKPTQMHRYWVSNTPDAFLEDAFDLPASARDPVMQRLKRLSTPFFYDQSTYVDQGVGDLWEHQAGYGYKNGVAVALHLPRGHHFLLGIDRDAALPKQADQAMHLLASVQLLAVHAQEAASRIFAPAIIDSLPQLTAREIEVLHWTMRGKSAWAVGNILGLTEHGVNHHMRNLFKKLGVRTKQQAIVKGAALGYL